MSRPGRLVLILVVAVALAALSVRIERVGPELAETGNLCGPRMDEICRAPRLNGGFPLAYLFDVPTVSVPDQLGLGEDDFRPVPFVADVLCYALLLWHGARLVARRRGARRGEGG